MKPNIQVELGEEPLVLNTLPYQETPASGGKKKDRFVRRTRKLSDHLYGGGYPESSGGSLPIWYAGQYSRDILELLC